MTELLPVAEVIQSVVRLQTVDGRVGTGFLVAHDKAVVLVTAAHGVPDETRAEFLLGSFYSPGNDRVELDRLDDPDMSREDDIAVYRFPGHPRHPILTSDRLSSHGIRFGEDVLILGYPSGRAFGANLQSHPVSTPMVKKGAMATMFFEDDNGSSRFYLDLVANPGFSGAPVVFKEAQSGQARIAGMVVQTATMDATSGDGGSGLSRFADLSVAVSESRILEHIRQSLV